ncbi:uncharacterized protein LOC130446701 isoform X4 [Diorhabda sublineata]|uniref:uncharacterized protein LOC130446701 isoform X4 n=1 Tax=Diorhabda sublineata TaxID=1163346 RepID=UPI0024E1623B|nr:uncharacterized protein LOC130446701 isoform X4 [Diorhabda sublineata]
MTFYLKPPRGNLNLYILEDCIRERLLCYNYLKNGSFDLTNFQYLVEDSSLDRTGHFILRLMACCNHTFEYDFVQKELKLLEVRLISYDMGDVKIFLKRILKHTREIISDNRNKDLFDIFFVFLKVICLMLSNVFLKHIFAIGRNGCFIGCNLFVIEVPYYFCLSMTANRVVIIKNGLAQVPCTLWKDLLLGLYFTYLKKVLKCLKYSGYITCTLEDSRIQNIFQLVKNYTSGKNVRTMENESSFINFNNISNESKFFPLCMQNLFKVLERTNRLCYNDSLYMKTIGMSMSDSLKFWENTYSKECSTSSRCSHSWQKNGKRYIYGIRHLYGLEGSRKDYHCRSCTFLQERSLGARDEGGCPFRKFDDNNLRAILKTIFPNNPDEIEVMIYERNNDPNVACNLFFNIVFNIITRKELNQSMTFGSPANYYFQLKKLLAKVS